MADRLNNYRQLVVARSVSFDDEMSYYSTTIRSLIDWSLTVVIQPDLAELWPLVFSTASLLRAADGFGIQRAVGAAFFGCAAGNSGDLTAQFFANVGVGESLLGLAASFRPDVGREYDRAFHGSNLELNLTTMLQLIVDGRWNATSCTNRSETERNNMANYWQVVLYLLLCI